MDIGERIKQVLKDSGMTISHFAQALSCSRENVYRILKKNNIDILLLTRIGEVLEHDFFKDISDDYYNSDK